MFVLLTAIIVFILLVIGSGMTVIEPEKPFFAKKADKNHKKKKK